MSIWGPSRIDSELDELVRMSGRVATRFDAVRPRPGEVPSITGTRFGGTPYAEPGDTWPRFDSRPYDFVAQFALRECFEPPTAAYDLITVFVSWHALDRGQAAEHGCLIRSYRNPSHSKAVVMDRPPATSDKDFQTVPCAVEARRVLTYPSPVGSFRAIPGIERAARDHKDLRKAYVKSLSRLDYDWQDPHTQVGGYPTWVHDNTLDDDELMFIAQIAHAPVAQFCIGDAAPVFIAARRSDPTRFEVDLCQSH
jgi:hypothetical protein